MNRPTLSRRRFLARSGQAVAGVVVAPSVVRRTAAQRLVDTLIVGSGYAGAVAAYRLAQAGRSAVVLERGLRWSITPEGDAFATVRNLDGRASWLGTFDNVPVFTGVLELVTGDGISVFGGAGVGGGSLVNNGITMQPPRRLFDASFGNLLSYAEMDSIWYPRARALLGASPIPEDVLNSSFYASARDFRDEAARTGLPTVRPDVLVDWQVVREEINGTAVPSAILGDSSFGINSGAKRSVDRTLLAAAEATGRITVLTLHQASDITRSGGRYVVTCQQLDTQGNVTGTTTFAAKEVFLAAGAVHTTELLVRAKARGDLPRLNEFVGTSWGNSGDSEYVRIGTQPVPPSTGGPADIAALDWHNPVNPLTLLNFPAFPSPDPTQGISAAITTEVCPAAGRFTYDPTTDSVTLSWPVNDPDVVKLTTAVQNSIDRMDAANPGTSSDFLSAAIASHSLGGAVLNRACRDDGSVYGYRGLYVIDSALIPGSTGAVPPSLTVTALADRCVTAILAGST